MTTPDRFNAGNESNAVKAGLPPGESSLADPGGPGSSYLQAPLWFIETFAIWRSQSLL
jgi:hypothetical protein